MNENMKYSLHYKKYEINSLRQFIKLHAVYLGQPSFRYSLSLNCGIYNHSQINQRCFRYLYKQRDEDFKYMKIHIFALRWKDEIKRSSQLRTLLKRVVVANI